MCIMFTANKEVKTMPKNHIKFWREAFAKEEEL